MKKYAMLNVSMILEILDGIDEETAWGVLDSVVSLYTKETPENIARLKQYLADENYDSIATLVHKMKNDHGMIGAYQAAKLCKNIESQIQAGQTDDLPDMIDQLEILYYAVVMELQSLKEAGSSALFQATE
ncbi:Hpt domain-containing protein [Heliophilum fasciatum]|uniref:HPt (Histidine-containing phosphotransfer) domain-containing protein n=1 Tax=Heliophilum fasciatum TaxID=35700 RepID=A0A4R2RKI8_9FIRM|nr:Hpt domain-containing protein [Heliophilum fasciatum]MCW2277980.1 HPt (histidine-containing phosphotransfer) domain-containing protein [Heliophilum fasciatum]TCP64400.1 HPt (histidine-containing phosphotransfer) domain-containing protein [Heliophilum fasciatum]